MQTLNFKNQDYRRLKIQLNSQNLFVDPLFPAKPSSIYYNQLYQTKFRSSTDELKIEWLRPWEICKILSLDKPHFEIDGFSRNDIKQGYIRNCWFITAINSLAEHKELLAQVIPTQQSFDRDYVGMFHFRFWRFDNWYDVVIDDQLPFSTSNKRLAFAHNVITPNEFWIALLEKAYAKINGSYEALIGGNLFTTMMDMTGGIIELKTNLELTPKSDYDQTWDYLLEMFGKKCMMSCMLPMNLQPNGNEVNHKNGLFQSHAFEITKFATVIVSQGSEVRLVRIKNLWANDIEWNGAWNDLSFEWSHVNEEDKLRLEFSIRNDGEFWMCFEDFMKTLSRIEFCHISNDTVSANSKLTDINKTQNSLDNYFWKSSTIHFSYSELNPVPICLLRIEHTANNLSDGFKTIIVSMIHKDANLVNNYHHDNIFLYKLYQLSDEAAYRLEISSELNMEDMTQIGMSKVLSKRDATGRFRVTPGAYVIVPLFADSGRNCEIKKNGEFIIRIFSDEITNANMLASCKENFWKKNKQPVFSFNEIVKVIREINEVQVEARRFY